MKQRAHRDVIGVLHFPVLSNIEGTKTITMDGEQYRLLFSAASDIVCLFDVRLALKGVSPNIKSILGYTAEELGGNPIRDLGLIHPEDVERVGENFERLISGGDVFSDTCRFITRKGKIWTGEVCGIPLKQGRRITGVICFARDTTGLIVNEKGCLGSIPGITRDISDRKQAEEALRDSEEKYRLLADNVGEAIFIAQDEHMKFANDKTAELLRYTRDELISLPIESFVHPLDREMVMSRHRKRLRGEILPERYSFRIIDREGSTKWVEINATVFAWEGRASALTFLTDITERRHKDEELNRYRQRLEEMVGERTAELVKANRLLQQEIMERKRSESSLRERELELEDRQRALEEMDTALRVLQRQRSEDRGAIERNLIANINTPLQLYIEKLKSTGLRKDQMSFISEIESHMKTIGSSFIRNLASEQLGLSPAELKVAYLIKEGKSSKEIADLLNVSLNAVLFHRNNIRKKTGLKNHKINLATHLQGLDQEHP